MYGTYSVRDQSGLNIFDLHITLAYMFEVPCTLVTSRVTAVHFDQLGTSL